MMEQNENDESGDADVPSNVHENNINEEDNGDAAENADIQEGDANDIADEDNGDGGDGNGGDINNDHMIIQNNIIVASMLFRAELLSQGYDEGLAAALCIVHQCLRIAARTLRQYDNQPPDTDDIVNIYITPTSGPVTVDGTINHDDALLPAWKEFLTALSAVVASPVHDGAGYIGLIISQLEIGQSVGKMLIDAFKSAPLHTLMLDRNGLNALRFGADAVHASSTLQHIMIQNNQVSQHDVESLRRVANWQQVARTCRRIKYFTLKGCRVGSEMYVLAKLETLIKQSHIMYLNLDGNDLGRLKFRWAFMENLLARPPGPTLSVLKLCNNMLKDDDATRLSKSLKGNTNLRELHLEGNDFTQNGINCFYRTVYPAAVSLMNVYKSNHTCRMYGIDDGNMLRKLSEINEFKSASQNRRAKILYALHAYVHELDRSTGCLEKPAGKYSRISGMPISLVPKVLAILRGSQLDMHHRSKVDWKHVKALDSIYMLLRQWNMPHVFERSVNGHLIDVRRRAMNKKRKLNSVRSKEGRYYC